VGEMRKKRDDGLYGHVSYVTVFIFN